MIDALDNAAALAVLDALDAEVTVWRGPGPLTLAWANSVARARAADGLLAELTADELETCTQLAAISRGRPSTRVPLRRDLAVLPLPGERVALIRACPTDVTEQAEQLDHYLEALAAKGRLQLELERRVAERTAELEAANAALERQMAERERTEGALRTAEERLRQAQKMEAIGRLAGGVAHDFNNLLTVVLGAASMLLDDPTLSEDSRGHVDHIRLAGDRAAALTRQLLAFGRRQILTPKVIDLGESVRQIVPMIARLVGEDVEVSSELAPNLAAIRVDPNQLAQVIMNLAVNARDAMPSGGRLTLRTENITVTAAPPELFGTVHPGRHVVLTVSDTGTGMNPETRARIFEPFFTTKEVGRGTGLGLPQVLGVVEQSGGGLTVDSEPGRGSQFRLYFPAVSERSQPTPRSVETPPMGHETVLLAEDDDQVRGVAEQFLRRLGYRVLAAASGDAALDIARRSPHVDVLLTDVVMPRLSGPELARAIVRERPTVRVIFMSGYTSDAMLHHGVMEDRVAFLPKPLDLLALGTTLRRVLDAPKP